MASDILPGYNAKLLDPRANESGLGWAYDHLIQADIRWFTDRDRSPGLTEQTWQKLAKQASEEAVTDQEPVIGYAYNEAKRMKRKVLRLLAENAGAGPFQEWTKPKHILKAWKCLIFLVI